MTGDSNGLARELAPLLAAVVEPAADFSSGRRGERAVRPQVQALCGAARSYGVAVEQLLVLIKNTWWQHGAVLEASHIDARDRLTQIVTLCIDEYYRCDDGGSPRGREAASSLPRFNESDARTRLS